MIPHTHRIDYKYGQTVRLKPIADIHRGSSHCDERAAKQWLYDDDECFFLGLGDLFDAIVTSDIRYRKSSDSTEGDDIIDEQVSNWIDWLYPLRDRIIGLGTGNHEDAIVKKCGTNPTKRLCQALEIPFLGYHYLLRLIFSENGSRGRTVIIRGHHGWGGGSRTQGADLTKYSRDLQYWDADIFLYGHVHRCQMDRVPRLGLAGGKVISKPKLMGICGTFLKTFSDTTDPTYSEIKGYPPAEIGGLTVNIKPIEPWVKYWIDI